MNPDPTTRAANIIIANRYLTLATTGAEGPWASPVAYARGRDSHLYYYSDVSARHSRNARELERAAAAIFDSQASSDDADGVQLQLTVGIVSTKDLQEVHSHYYVTMWPNATQRKNWEQSIEHFVEPGPLRFYRLKIIEAYVLDLDAYENVPQSQAVVDRRTSIDVHELQRLIAYGNGSV